MLMLGLTSCEKDKIEDQSVITVDNYHKNEFDKWLEANYVNPYNISFKYRYEEIESDYDYYTVPADMDMSIIMDKALPVFSPRPWRERLVTLSVTFMFQRVAME